jgi:hypothetical protein
MGMHAGRQEPPEEVGIEGRITRNWWTQILRKAGEQGRKLDSVNRHGTRRGLLLVWEHEHRDAPGGERGAAAKRQAHLRDGSAGSEVDPREARSARGSRRHCAGRQQQQQQRGVEGSGKGSRRPDQTRTDAVVASAGFVVTPTQFTGKRPTPSLVTLRGGAHFCRGVPAATEASLDGCTRQSASTKTETAAVQPASTRYGSNHEEGSLNPAAGNGEGRGLTEQGLVLENQN